MLGAGVDAFLSKPIVIDELLGELRKHIDLVEPQNTTV
jgi:DNA-binding response OmpR family regulator